MSVESPRPAPLRLLLPAVLSLLLPGLGQLATGAPRTAFAFFAAGLLLPPGLAVAMGLGALGVATWWWVDRLLGLLLRLLSAGLAVSAGRRRWVGAPPHQGPEVPLGAFGLFIIGWIVLSLLTGRAVQQVVPAPVALSEGQGGLWAGEYVQASRFGAAGQPRPGTWALYVVDPPDASAGPATPLRRDAFLARVTGTGPGTFTVEGRDAAIPLDDYVGWPVGVVVSRGDAGVRWDRLGVAPNP